MPRMEVTQKFVMIKTETTAFELTASPNAASSVTPVGGYNLQTAVTDLARSEESETEEISDAIKARAPIFLAKRQSDIQTMRDALPACDFSLIQQTGHNCKGTGAGYGFPAISRIGLAIEMAAKAHNSDDLEKHISELDRFVSSALSAIQSPCAG